MTDLTNQSVSSDDVWPTASGASSSMGGRRGVREASSGVQRYRARPAGHDSPVPDTDGKSQQREGAGRSSRQIKRLEWGPLWSTVSDHETCDWS